MKRITRPRHTAPSIEPLESRIAPALLVQGANLLGGLGNASVGETSIGATNITVVKVLSGSAVVWFDGGDISSISFAADTSLEVWGNVENAVVGNLTKFGRLSDADNNPGNGEDGAVLLANNLTGLIVHPLGGQKGSVGEIVTGGSVANVNISDSIGGIYAGDSVFRAESQLLAAGAVNLPVGFGVNPLVITPQLDFTLIPALAKTTPGASIKNVTLNKASATQIFSGSGTNPLALPTAAGVAGGNIENLTINSASLPTGASGTAIVYEVLAGSGGNGKTGGAGGSILGVAEKDAAGKISITSGTGGNGATGAAGAGGAIKNLNLQSDSTQYTVTTGSGGNGVSGGVGGLLLNGNFASITPASGLFATADFNGDGSDDVLVVDSATGTMVINANNGSGSDFTPILQYLTVTLDPVNIIEGAGSTPSSVAVGDFNGDDKPDIFVAYKGSSSVAVFINQGLGSFYDAVDEKFVTVQSSLGFEPGKIAVGQFAGGSELDIAVLEIKTVNGKKQTIVHAVEQSVDFLTGNASLELRVLNNTIFGTATDLAAVQAGASINQLFVGLSDGTIHALSPSSNADAAAFTLDPTGIKITGGIATLDVDESGTRLLALSTTGRTANVFDIAGKDLTPAGPVVSLLAGAGKPIIAHFVHDTDPVTEDGIAVLFTSPTSSHLDLYNAHTPAIPASPTDPLFDPPTSLSTTLIIKNFLPAYTAGQADFAALGGSLNRFLYSPSLNDFATYSLPFVGKTANLLLGNGGDGTTGAAGAGGGVSGFNIEASEVIITAGQGGNTITGAAGAGGSILNPVSFLVGTTIVLPKLKVESSLQLFAGNGGTPTGVVALTARGGAGGSLGGLEVELATGNLVLQAGDAGDGNGGAGGAGGSINNVISTTLDGSITVTAGIGGDTTGPKAAGGAGGNIAKFRHTQTLDPAKEDAGHTFTVSFTAGDAGSATAGLGGKGGDASGIQLDLDVPNSDTGFDTTEIISLTAGDGGNGTIGGAAGTVKTIRANTILDQSRISGSVIVNSVVMNIFGGSGGDGSAGAGGKGGDLFLGGLGSLTGITHYDIDSLVDAPALGVIGGDGGNGSTHGGAGGNVGGVYVQNALFVDGSHISGTQLFSAAILGGNGGAGGSGLGGKGGDVTTSSLAVEGGPLFVAAGAGGNGGTTVGSTTGIGGKGGNVGTSYFASAYALFSPGILTLAGSGGNGVTAGGAGGGFAGITVDVPTVAIGQAGIFVAGHGGSASGANGIGGAGGDVNGFKQTKGINSVINLLQAGNGGDAALGKGGRGGNVSKVSNSGFFGKPNDSFTRLGAFDESGNAQGLFVGHGGAGVSAGLNGSVTGVIARQISAIAAAQDASGFFGLAEKVSAVKADLIGYDVDGDLAYDGDTTSPLTGLPVDGFLLAKVLTGVTGNRAAFTFSA